MSTDICNNNPTLDNDSIIHPSFYLINVNMLFNAIFGIADINRRIVSDW